MPLRAIARLIQTMLYSQRFFPYYVYNILGGIEEDGKPLSSFQCSVFLPSLPLPTILSSFPWPSSKYRLWHTLTGLPSIAFVLSPYPTGRFANMVSLHHIRLSSVIDAAHRHSCIFYHAGPLRWTSRHRPSLRNVVGTERHVTAISYV